MTDQERPPGLRERKKEATREALSLAALRLARERGLENVRVEDIAAEAGVSARTFNNYFSSKYEAIATRHIDRMRQSARFLRERPPGEPLWEAVTHSVLGPFAGFPGALRTPPDPAVRDATRLILAEPALQAELLRVCIAGEGEFAAAVAARTGADRARDLHPRLVASAVNSAIGVAIDQWLRADPPVALESLLREALRQTAAGLPEPAKTEGER
jgi:AcrR family transcriptional regulator